MADFVDDFLDAFEESDDEAEATAAAAEGDPRVRLLELALLDGDAAALAPLRQELASDDDEDLAATLEAIAAVLEGRFADALGSPIATPLLRRYVADEDDGPEEILDALRRRVYAAVGKGPGAALRAVGCLAVGVAAFNVFLQVNYTGPLLEVPELEAFVLPPIFEDVRTEGEAKAAEEAAKEQKDDNANAEAEKEPTQLEDETAQGVERGPELDVTPGHAAVARAAVRLLAADGLDPYALAGVPQMLLVARAVFHSLGLPRLSFWHVSVEVGAPQVRGSTPKVLTPAQAETARARLELCEYDKAPLAAGALPAPAALAAA
uniref:Uncharacterized protein n=1 Tax=Phaeomonas parva TaxID=124430 RepID=A0A7S1UIE3_9STRA|mmetsp:Transcript_7208/g.21089  ORF Transcript_7208/g.21089 Transcript_7208/m.21089 type:complete len:321 (+) Transcript_7208:111-1073(+)